MKPYFKYNFSKVISFLLLLSFVKCEITYSDFQYIHIRPLSKTEKDIVNSSTQFGFNLIKEISKNEINKNIIISPLSVSTALGMVLNGASDETYDQMKTALGFSDFKFDDINKSYQSLDSLLKYIDENVIFNSANSIWHHNEFSVEQNFIEINKKYFNAEVNKIDFSNPVAKDIINNWVKEATNSKIPQIIDKINPEIVMFLINTIYFKGNWQYRFDKNSTREDIFYIDENNTVTCQMMSQKNQFNFYHDENIEAVELPYGNSSFNMMIILPSLNKKVDDVISMMNTDNFDFIKNKFVKKEITIMLPKFKLEYTKTLNDALMNLGMKDAFMPERANFSKISRLKNLFISEVIHKTFIEVNEEGTEAAAVTSIGVGVTSIGNYFKVDRPFLFLIYEKNTNTILFIGKVINPAEGS
ncbi:MAG: serpin family protein [Melioribacter sp.]|uniref:serpin family protein n=1 Tax=Rosettibacter primus TaxID=3111523 RepID=UPI00247B46AF|nr:serpin family protein [Melioribacter sp.]